MNFTKYDLNYYQIFSVLENFVRQHRKLESYCSYRSPINNGSFLVLFDKLNSCTLFITLLQIANKMPLPWELTGIVQVIKLIQLLYIDYYPFRYKPLLQWVVKEGVLRVEVVKYRNPRKGYLMKLLPLVLNSATAFNSLSCILIFPRAYLNGNAVMWKDFRFWGWICGGGAAGILAFVYSMIMFGYETTLVRISDEIINLELQMLQGNTFTNCFSN